MRIERLDIRGRAAIDRALRAGERVDLVLGSRLPRGFRADAVAPLVDAVVASDRRLARALEVHLPPPARPGRRHRVTAIVPTNRGTPLSLRALRHQDCEVEVLVLANGGAEPEGDRVLHLPWEGHGRTRQRGVEAATGEFVLFTVDDALVRGRGCVSTLVEALLEGGYDAVFGRQVAWATADPVTRRRLHAWTPPGVGHRPVGRLDHVFALARRETLLRHPLPDVPIAEDLHWGRGRRIGYVPGAPVVHSHPRTPASLYRRTRAIHEEHIALGEPPRVPDLPALVRALPGVLGPTLEAGPAEALNQLAELAGQWRAARRARARGGRRR